MVSIDLFACGRSAGNGIDGRILPERPAAYRFVARSPDCPRHMSNGHAGLHIGEWHQCAFAGDRMAAVNPPAPRRSCAIRVGRAACRRSRFSRCHEAGQPRKNAHLVIDQQQGGRRFSAQLHWGSVAHMSAGWMKKVAHEQKSGAADFLVLSLTSASATSGRILCTWHLQPSSSSTTSRQTSRC